MKEPILRNTSEISLLEERSKYTLKSITPRLYSFVINNDEFFRRCLSKVEDGRNELMKSLEDARRVIFNQGDLINWLHKIKSDAVGETESIFIKYEASIGMEESKIDFERAGLLAGVYDEAQRYLSLIVAIEPLDVDKAHYSVLDRLEELDELFLKTDNIPGYYVIQKDKKILKQQFEIQNLDDFWLDYLSLRNKHNVTEGFGDIRYLLSQYHFEFRWEMIKIRPREDIKKYLDFHLKKFSGDPIDFINHVEFRVMPKMDGVARSDYPIYKLIIKEWLKEKRTGLNNADEEYLLESVTSVSATFLDNVFVYRKMQDENKYNTTICGLLSQRFSSKGWSAKDQTLGGSSNSTSQSNRAGMAFRDLVITDEKNHHLSAIEFFRLNHVPNTNEGDTEISQHLTKIFRNEPIGLSPLFVVVYCETKSFSKTWEKYLSYIGSIDFVNYRLVELIKDVPLKPERVNINVAKAVHIRETSEVSVYHIFLNIFP